MHKKKKVTIIVLVILCIGLVISLISATTYALYSSDAYASNPNSYSTGLLLVEAKSKSDNISLTAALPMTDEDGKNTTPYVFTIKNTGNLDYVFNVKLLSTGDASNTFDSSYIKLQIDDGNVVTLSSLTGSIIKSDVTLLSGESIDISIRAWLSIDTPNTQLGKNFNSKILTDGQAIYTESNREVNTIANYITNLYDYSVKTPVVNNGITYNYATSVSLMNDRLGGTTAGLDAGNIRYYGASPNNYIYFNCSDYSNQSADTCELWRIIGVFDGKVKIIRNESFGKYSWDTSASSINSGYGINEWSQADLMKLLNPGYESETVGGSLYWNSGSGTCYKGNSNATTSCDFTSTGLKNVATRNMIAEVAWNLGGYSSNSVYSNQMYGYERGTTTVSNPSDGVKRTTSWIGKIALAYPSDYGYAADFSSCSKQLSGYNDVTCTSVNWMKTMFGSSNNTWLLTPNSSNARSAWGVHSSGYAGYGYSVSNTNGAGPVLYLNSELEIGSGNGSTSNPYRLSES